MVCKLMSAVLAWLLAPLLLPAVTRNAIVQAANPCELRGCPESKAGHLNVHILSHSHNDAGWFYTLAESYDTKVTRIYDSTTEALGENPSRRYVSAENVFFSLWLHNRPEKIRRKVHNLVTSGRLQFVGGGWTQNDEATTHYTAIIDQMTLGLRFLNDTFGPHCGVPSVAWQADPFGHTATQAALFARMAFSSLMLARISFDTKDKWQKSRAMEFVWEADGREMGGDGGNILAWVPENTYNSPANMCAEWDSCYSGLGHNVDPWDVLLSNARDQAQVYTNNTVAVMSGGDFNFVDGVERFRNQDHAILIANTPNASKSNYPPINVFHSTPACYIEALHKSYRGWPRYSGDLLPYTDKPGRTWTGFYTSRPNMKMMVRYANGFLQACKQLSVLGGEKGDAALVRKLGEAVATLQHHDGITGTSSVAVIEDYANMLYQGMKTCQPLIARSLMSLLNPGSPVEHRDVQQLGFCHLLNESHCPHTERVHEFSVLVYNPASIRVFKNVRLPLVAAKKPTFRVTAHGGMRVQSQVIPLPSRQHNRPNDPRWSLLFQAQVPPLGATLYYVKSAGATNPTNVGNFHKSATFIENKRYHVKINPQTGLVSSIQLRGSNAVVRLQHTFAAYKFTKPLSKRLMNPGAYVFTAESKPEGFSKTVHHRFVKGPLVEEVHQTFNEQVSQVIALHKDSPYVDFTWTVKRPDDPPSTQVLGCDTVSLFQSDLNSNGFHTDSNGWRDVRRTVTHEDGKLHIPSNFYPVVSWIYVEDEARDLRMVIFPDRPQGGTSLRKGQLQLMVFRWHSTNDDLGNPENLEEKDWDGHTTVARGTHRLFLGSRSNAQCLLRHQALGLVYRPFLVFAPAQWNPKRGTFSGLRFHIPKTVHILTLERLSASQALLRLEHVAVTNATAQVNVARLLPGYRLAKMRPLTLGANQFLPGPTRHRWPEESTGGLPEPMNDVAVTIPEMNTSEDTGDSVVLLKPGEIATFLADIITE